jgi:hypothetical protein
MVFFKDGNGSLCVEWEQAFGHKKRAWIQVKDDPDKDWAKTPQRRYLNVVRVGKDTGNPGGNPTDFPVFCDMPDRQILEAFVLAVCAITGLELKR